MNAAAALRLPARSVSAPVSAPARPLDAARCVRAVDLLAPLVDALATRFALSPVETSVLGLVLAGRNCERIAARLGLRETTVHKHLHRVCAKTGTESRQELFDLGLRLAARDAAVLACGRPALAA
jgi:DNA-binding CsgD family transcriptional regulator